MSASPASRFKILVMVREFLPSVGGIQTATDVLVREFLRRGVEIIVVTNTQDPAAQEYPCRVVRKPSVVALMKLCVQADIVYQSGLSLRWILPPFVIGKPIVITHHMLLVGNRLICSMKRALAKVAVTVAVSRFIADHYKGASFIVSNPYDDEVFLNCTDVERNQDCVFVGRLIEDKGADVAIQAIGRLKLDGKRVRLAVVGRGPQEDELRALAHRIGVGDLVSFVGQVTGVALSELLNRHKLILIPSRWDEPFGLVALEAIACGCVPIASRVGGLPEALGPCGLLIPPSDINALAKAIDDQLGDRNRRQVLLGAASTHLASHSPSAIAREYFSIVATSFGRQLKMQCGSPPPCHH